MYGVAAALGSVIPNGIQASAAIVVAVPVMYVRLLDKYQLSQRKAAQNKEQTASF